MKTLLFSLGTLALVGCGLHPVGPLAKQMPVMQQSQPIANTPNSSTNGAGPTARAKPPVPTTYVTPEEVNADNAHDAATRLGSEINNDMKSTVNGPVTVQVSHIKGGVPQP